jgi:adenylate cyclase
MPESAERSLVQGTDEALPQPDKPSIAVLAFTNMSGDPAQEYFSDGIADDLITELSRSRSLCVIARNSSFSYKGRAVDVKQVARELGVRYLVEGGVRRSAARMRVTAQLIDAQTGNHIWAERYDRDVIEVFAVQDEITLAVTRAIRPAVANAEQRRSLRKAPSHLGAWEAYQRGLWHLSKKGREDVSQARAFFDRALELDPTLAAAHTALAALFTTEGVYLTSRPMGQALALAAEEARKALDLDPTDADAHAFRGLGSGHAGDYVGALDHIERALSINPSSAPAHHVKGWLLVMSGGSQMEGREAIQLASRLDPSGALDVGGRVVPAVSHYFEHDYEIAVAMAKRLLSERPDHPYAFRWLAASLGQLGRTEEARDAMDKAIMLAPSEIELFVRHRAPWMRQSYYEHMLDGLRKAGWRG